MTTLRLWIVFAALIAGVLSVGIGWSRHASARAALLRADPERILADPVLAATAMSVGRDVFEARCASCHRGNGAGDVARGVPDLRDGDYLYGTGRVSEIEEIVLYGIRSGNRRGWNLASMPAYGRARPAIDKAILPLSPHETDDVVSYLLALSGKTVPAADIARGKAVYVARACWDCHGADAGGDSAIGAPSLTDAVTLYGDGSRRALASSIRAGRAGVSPAFGRLLLPVEARAVAVYVASRATVATR